MGLDRRCQRDRADCAVTSCQRYIRIGLHRMSLKKSLWLSGAATATWAIFIVLCLVGIDNARIGTLRSKQGLQLSKLGTSSIAPDNLPRAADLLRTSVPVQNRDFPIEALTQSRAWTTLQNTLSAYAERLKLLDAQNRELDHRLQKRSLWTDFAALGAIIINGLLLMLLKRRSGSSNNA